MVRVVVSNCSATWLFDHVSLSNIGVAATVGIVGTLMMPPPDGFPVATRMLLCHFLTFAIVDLMPTAMRRLSLASHLRRTIQLPWSG